MNKKLSDKVALQQSRISRITKTLNRILNWAQSRILAILALDKTILFNLLNPASGFLFTTLQAVYNIINGDLYIKGNDISLQPSKSLR